MNKTENEKDIYDVKNYTDEELFEILDLMNPSDRELEAKIIQMCNRYRDMQNDQGDKFYDFFQDIYDRFFDDDDENSDNNDNSEYDNNSEDDDTNNSTQKKEKTVEGFGNDNTTKPSNALTTTPVAFTKPPDFAQDKLNPLLQNTIKRIVSIDSQYRDDKTTSSTEYTFSLSEPLKDVVSLKLYSIQIPQTWYTVSTNFGCNFFYLKGNSPGLDNGFYDYQIDISAGNYTAPNLTTAINKKIQEIIVTTPDVSFGRTNIGYNTNAALSTISVEMKKIYNESSYYLHFPTWTNPNSNSSLTGPRYKSIPGFFGFNYQDYYLNCLYSTSSLLLTTDTAGQIIDEKTGTYYTDSTNNYFTVIKYIGPGEYSHLTSIVDLSFNISLALLDGVHTRNDIVNDLSNQLANNSYLSGSYIRRINITDASLNGYNKSYYEIKINYNRLTTNNIENTKTYIQFPTEIDSPIHSKVWTGQTSCLRFQNVNNELNNVISETSPIAQQSGKYIINNSPYIYLKCIKPNYNVIQNNYTIDLSNSNTVGYTLSQYISAINTAIVNTNNRTITTKNPLGDFNMNTFTSYVDVNSYVNIQVDINKIFTRDMYCIDVRGSFLDYLIGLSGEYLNGVRDLSGSSYTFTSSFEENSSYQVNSSYLLIAKPSILNYGNQNATSFTVNSDGIGITYNTYQEMEIAINNAFVNFTNGDGQQVFSGTTISMKANEITGFVDCVFTVAVKKSITQNDYKIGFVDVSTNFNIDNSINLLSTSWSRNLNIDTRYLDSSANTLGYNLADVLNSYQSYDTLIASSPITVNTIKFIDGVNNYFTLIPWEEGVSTSPPYYTTYYDKKGANDIRITIPATDNIGVINYTRENLIIAMNVALNLSPLTTGSSMNIMTVNNIEYVKYRLNVNKIYTASDYKVVFYDQLSFIKCYNGVTSITNTTWDTTLGWLIGFHNTTELDLNNPAYGKPGDFIQVVSDTTVSVNIYDYFLLCIDDFNPNHLNDGLVTLTSAQQTIPLPSYANKANYTCDPTSGLLTYNAALANSGNFNKLTQKQIYTLTEIANSKRTSTIISSTANVNAKSYGSGPFVKDVFGFIPMKTAGLAPGLVYVDYGGTLQNQERTYFGPVNIHKMAVSLVSNRGDVVNLNGSDWSFSLMAEQLYQQKPTVKKKDDAKKGKKGKK